MEWFQPHIFAHMMFEGKHIHYSPADHKPLCSYSIKLCKQRRINGYAFCIRHILEDKSAPFKQCAHVAKYNSQKCTNPIPSNEDREFCNSHMQVAGMAPKKERKMKKEKDCSSVPDGKLKFADRLKALLKTGNEITSDDQVSADDPYAFPEPTSECSQENKTPPSSLSGSPTSQEVPSSKVCCPEINNKLEPTNKTMSSLSQGGENKLKQNAPKSSMNRLQAKIARNKILDKLKKNQESSLNAGYVTNSSELSKSNIDNVHSSLENVAYHHSPSDETSANGVFSATEDVTRSAPPLGMPPSLRLPGSSCFGDAKSQMAAVSEWNRSPAPFVPPVAFQHSGISTVSIKPKRLELVRRNQIPEPLQRVQYIWDRQQRCKADLYPLGIEVSDTDSDDTDSESVQRHWFYTWDKDDVQVEAKMQHVTRTARLSVMRAEVRRKYNQLCKSQAAAQNQQKPQTSLVNSLLNSTRWYPNRTASLVQNMQITRLKPKKLLPSTEVVKRDCCYKNEKDVCGSAALPFTRHCVKHVMYNVDQLLFEHCTAKFADNTQCCIPVFDICHELPLCLEHARKRDNYNKMSAEPKPKKPRKKTKPSALTRPPKRGKKKKRQSTFRPMKLPGQVVVPSADTALNDVQQQQALQMELDSNELSPGPAELNAEDISKDLDDPMETDMDNELDGQLSPGSIEKSLELPLDAAELANQATRLLEEHDFTEVLNKIPDDAFNDLFTGKNGEFLPTKEETEELERALAAVDKDVKSLEKMSVDSNDISELATSMDLHDSLLNAESLTQDLDERTLSELTQGNISMENLNVITNSLSTNDLNSISQVLSNIPTETLVPTSLPASIVDGGGAATILQGHHLPGVHLLPDLVQGQLQLQVPIGSQATNFVLSPQLLGATFTTDTTSAAQGTFTNSSTITAFPQTLAQTIPLSQDGISISLQSQLQGIRAGQWIFSPADASFTPMLYHQNGFPISSQPITQHVSTISNLKFPFTAPVDMLKSGVEETEVVATIDQSQTLTTINGSGIGPGTSLPPTALTNAFPVQATDSPKETVS